MSDFELSQIHISKTPTNTFLCRYYTHQYVGLATFTISKKMKRKIKLGFDLITVGSGFIKGLTSLNIIYHHDPKPIFFVPPLDPAHVLTDQTVIEDFYVGNNDYWYVEKIVPQKSEHELPIEAFYIKVRKDGISLEAIPAVNDFNNSRMFSAIIPFREIGI